jgi:hypothetical protein
MWTADDREKIFAYEAFERGRCKCGTFPYEWTDKKGVPLDDPPYEVYHERCHGCATVSDERAKIPEGDHDQVNTYLRVPEGDEEELQ